MEEISLEGLKNFLVGNGLQGWVATFTLMYIGKKLGSLGELKKIKPEIDKIVVALDQNTKAIKSHKLVCHLTQKIAEEGKQDFQH